MKAVDLDLERNPMRTPIINEYLAVSFSSMISLLLIILSNHASTLGKEFAFVMTRLKNESAFELQAFPVRC